MILNIQKEACKTCQDKKCNNCAQSLNYIIQSSFTATDNYIYIQPFQDQYWYVLQPLKDITVQQLALVVKYGSSISKQKYDSIKQGNVKRHYKRCNSQIERNYNVWLQHDYHIPPVTCY